MRVSLESPTRRFALMVACFLLTAAYVVLIVAESLAAIFASSPKLAGLQRAVWLQPGNAEYHYYVGRYFSLVQPSPDDALRSFRKAVEKNPYQARYWFALAGTCQLLGDPSGQEDAVEKAVAAEPTTPDVAWEAANFHVVQGDTAKALQELQVVLANDPPMISSALNLCWRLKADASVILREALPPSSSVYAAFLQFLTGKRETAGAAQVWAQIVKLGEPVEKRDVFNYVRYLISQREAGQAALVWRQAANLSGLSDYQSSADNLVVNGDFSLRTLNGGLDWIYNRSPEVSLALDPTQFHTGHSSLYITFDSQGLEDAGIRQFIPVQPGKTYDFSGYYKADDLECAGGPQLTLQDAYTGKTFFASEDMGNVDFWKQVHGTFTTAADSKLLVLRVRRVPARAPIKGRLWIDDLRLAPIQQEEPGG